MPASCELNSEEQQKAQLEYHGSHPKSETRGKHPQVESYLSYFCIYQAQYYFKTSMVLKRKVLSLFQPKTHFSKPIFLELPLKDIYW